MALIIKVLLENRLGKGQDSLLQAKPGLSLLVEDETSRVLFDTGPDGTFLHNAQRMGVSLSDLTATVLSHGHYDHCGGAAGQQPYYLSSADWTHPLLGVISRRTQLESQKAVARYRLLPPPHGVQPRAGGDRRTTAVVR